MKKKTSPSNKQENVSQQETSSSRTRHQGEQFRLCRKPTMSPRLVRLVPTVRQFWTDVLNCTVPGRPLYTNEATSALSGDPYDVRCRGKRCRRWVEPGGGKDARKCFCNYHSMDFCGLLQNRHILRLTSSGLSSFVGNLIQFESTIGDDDSAPRQQEIYVMPSHHGSSRINYSVHDKR